MHADHLAGMTLAEVGAKHGGRHRKSVQEIFRRRGLAVRHSPRGSSAKDPVTGRVLPLVPKTEAEIAALIERATRIMVPPELRVEWRRWNLSKRAAFIARIRERLRSPHDRPETPFSANVIPFDYGTAAAWEIVRRANAGRPSRRWVTRICPSSQGVIYQGKLYFWSSGEAYLEGCQWTPERSRPVLSRVIWEQHHGRPVLRGQVVRHADGNPNNFDPANLVLATKDDVARENQAAALTRKSRAITAALLQQATPPDDTHAPDIRTLRARDKKAPKRTASVSAR